MLPDRPHGPDLNSSGLNSKVAAAIGENKDNKEEPMKLVTENAEPLSVSFGGCSSPGVKPDNEDAFAAHQPPAGARHYKGVVACVADGVSCSDNAQQASQTSVTQFVEDYYSTPDSWPVKKSAARVLSSMNAWLFHYGQQAAYRHNGMVTTFSALVCKSTTAHIFHVGDSRVYLLQQGKLLQLTRDHTNRQLGDSAVLTRALGMDSRLEVDYLQESLTAGDLFVLTTDGFHNFVSPEKMAEAVQQSDCLESCAQALVQMAADNGSQDNISCLLVRIDSLPKEEIDEVHRQLTELEIPPVMEPGMSIDDFLIESVVHSGTRSHIYRVTEKNSGQHYILKVPSPNFAEDPQYLEGFIREQWAGRRIDNPRVMKIYQRPESSPFLYHLCEPIDGQTLSQWMLDNPRASLQSVRQITQSIVSALRVFQRLGMQHRDLKPENIMINNAGEAVLIDFGTVWVEGLEEISSVIQEDVPVGSVDYIAPELLLETIHPASDLFSLGVIVYEMLTGEMPYKSVYAKRNYRHFSDWHYRSLATARPDVPDWVDLALKQATEPDPRRRYPAYSEFLQDLTVPNKQLVARHKSAPLLERNPLLFWRLLSLLLLGLLVAEFFWNHFAN